MDITPRRLKAKRFPLLRRPQQKVDDAAWSSITLPTQRGIVRRARAIRRGLIVAIWTAISMPLQALLLTLPGEAKIAFSRCYWSVMCQLLGLQVRVIGAPAQATADGRPIIYVSNHSSWLDVPVLGGRLSACFIAKDQVAGWPIIGTVARLGRTVYVRRSRASTGRERDDMGARLSAGDNLILFPEGTTSDGSRVLPFRSAFLSVAELPVTPDKRTPIVQPVSLVYDRLSGLPMGRAARPLFAWYGDMDLFSHFWQLAQHQGFRASVLLHQPLDPERYASRKELAAACWTVVAGGASTLRQNRPVVPAAAPEPLSDEETNPAFV